MRMLDEQVCYVRVKHAVPLMPRKDIALIMIQCQTNTSVNGALQSIELAILAPV